MKSNEKAVLNKECHSRKLLSGISPAFNSAQGGDPRLQASGMTKNVNVGQVLPDNQIKCHSKPGHYLVPRPVVLLYGVQESHRMLLHNDEILNQVQDDRRGGFTLIELLVVVLIIGILAAVALPQYQKAVKKSRFMQLIVLQNAINKAEQVYHLTNGKYSANVEELDIQMPGTVTYSQATERSQVQVEDFDLNISPSWSQGYVKRTGLSYIISHATGSRECRDYASSKQNQEICLSLGGIESSCPSCNYKSYRLPK